MSRIYVGDIGKEFIMDTGTDLTATTLVALNVRRPDGTDVVWAGTVYNTTRIKYTTVAGDLDAAGTHDMQTYAEWAGGVKLLGRNIKFTISEKWT